MSRRIEESGFAAESRDVRRRYFEGTIQTCEDALAKLGKARDAWRVLEVHWNSTPRPAIGRWKDKAIEALGTEYTVVRKPKCAQDQLPAAKKLKRIADRIAKEEEVDGLKARHLAMKRNPELVARQHAQWRKACGSVRHSEAWRHAQVAAIMASALDHLDAPAIAFAAGIAEGEYHQFNHLRKYLPTVTRGKDEGRRSAQKRAWGRLKRGKISAHTRVIRAAVHALGKDAAVETVLTVLTGETIAGVDTEAVLEEIRNGIEPIIIPLDEPAVRVEDGRVFFQFADRPSRSISRERFENAVTEARATIS